MQTEIERLHDYITDIFFFFTFRGIFYFGKSHVRTLNVDRYNIFDIFWNPDEPVYFSISSDCQIIVIIFSILS